MSKEKYLLLILEKEMEDRYVFLEQSIPFDKITLNLRNVRSGSVFVTILKRIRYRRYLNDEYEKYKEQISKYKKIFVSNGEGFIAINLIRKIGQEHPEIQIITLQHGIFGFDYIGLKTHSKSNKTQIKPGLVFNKNFRKTINKLSKILLNIYILGEGFGSLITHKFIVYNQIYKDLLIAQGWKSEDVIISSYLLKGVPDRVTNAKIGNESKYQSVIFFLQPLYESGITDEKTEFYLHSNVISLLSRVFEKVYIKQHPYQKVRIDNKEENIEFISSNINDYLSTADCITSYFSTTLVDYEYTGLPPVAIYSKKLNVDNYVYNLFKNIYFFDQNHKTGRFNYETNSSYIGDDSYFLQSGVTEEDLYKIL